MKPLLSILAFFLVVLTASAQEPVQGTFHYKASINWPDSNAIAKQWNVVLFTNDTISRVDTETGQFGTQIYIRHMALKKAYLLLNVDGKKFAIQSDLGKKTEVDSLGYTFKKKLFGKKVSGIKCRKYYIQDKGQPEGYYCYFAKKIPNKYLEVYEAIPGLAVDYYLPSADGLIHYQLVKSSFEPVNRDLFGIPSDYKRVTFEEFVDQFQGAY